VGGAFFMAEMPRQAVVYVRLPTEDTTAVDAEARIED